jgi:tetratricopeptide (TPR) repeat protein
LRHAERAVELDGGTIDSLDTAARAHAAMSQYHFTQVVEEADPSQRRVKAFQAEESQKKVDAALQRLSERFPNSLAVVSGRVQADIARGNFSAAAARGLNFLEKQQREIPELRLLVARAYLANRQPERTQEQLSILLRHNPTDIQARLLMAEAYFRRHLSKRAIAELENARRIEPRNIDVLFQLGTAYLNHGRPEDARALYEGIVNSYPADAANPRVRAVRNTALLGLAKALLDIQTADVAQRRQHLDLALNTLAPMADPPGGQTPDPRAVVLTGEIMEAKGEPLRAVELYQRATQVAPRHAQAYRALGVIYYQRGQFDDAIKLYTEKIIPKWRYDVGSYARLALLHLARGGPKDADQAAQISAKVMEMLQTATGNVAANMQLEEYFRSVRITALIAARRAAEARDEIKSLRQIEPSVRESYVALVDSCRTAEKARLLGKHQGAVLFYQAANRSKDAIDAAEKAVTAFSNNLFLLNQLAELHLGRADHASHAATLQRIISLANQSPRLMPPAELQKTYTTVIKTLLNHLQSEDPKAADKAMLLCNEALEKWPQNVDLLLEKARIHEERREHPVAIKTLEQAVALSAQGTPPWILAKKRLALQYYTTKQIDLAAQTFDDTEQFTSGEALWLNNGAWFHATKSTPDFDRASALAEQAKGAAPENPHIRDTLGWIYHLGGIYYKAKPELEYAARMLRNDANIAYHLGANQLKTNELEASVKNLRRALDLARRGALLREMATCEALLKEAERQLAGSGS